jgi:hypothetical protein
VAKGQSRGNREPKNPGEGPRTCPEGTAGIGCESTEVVTDEPVNLDGHRGMAAQRDTEIRRDLYEVQADQAALRGRQEELENFLDAAPATTRAEAAACARYLLQLFATTPEAQDPRRQRLIARALDDLAQFAE